MELLDFSDYDGENQFSLFEKLCEKFNGADGYYIVAGVKRGGMDKDYIQYIENWKIIGERLDPVTANILLEK